MIEFYHKSNVVFQLPFFKGFNKEAFLYVLLVATATKGTLLLLGFPSACGNDGSILPSVGCSPITLLRQKYSDLLCWSRRCDAAGKPLFTRLKK